MMPNDQPIKGKGLLTPIQKAFLSGFTTIPDQDQFYLTGGTALAEFFLGHRLSFDLDLFTSEASLILPVSYEVEKLSGYKDLQVNVVRRFSTFVELLIVQGDKSLKVDLALDSPFRFEPPKVTEHGYMVNGYQDLRVDKLLAYYGRAEPRDAVDLYFILLKEPLKPLLEQASTKDPGFDLYWFAVALNRCNEFPDEADRWPIRMLVHFSPVEIKRLFSKFALELMDGLAGNS